MLADKTVGSPAGSLDHAFRINQKACLTVTSGPAHTWLSNYIAWNTHTQKGSSVWTDELCRSYTEDEGRSLGVGFQERASNHPKLLRSRVVVVSVGVKASRTYLEQVRIRETNESEPPLTRRNPETCRQNQGRLHLLGQACRAPEYWASGGRRIGGVKLIQASVWNCGNQSFRCQGRSTSGRNHEARVPMRSTGTDRPV